MCRLDGYRLDSEQSTVDRVGPFLMRFGGGVGIDFVTCRCIRAPSALGPRPLSHELSTESRQGTFGSWATFYSVMSRSCHLSPPTQIVERQEGRHRRTKLDLQEDYRGQFRNDDERAAQASTLGSPRSKEPTPCGRSYSALRPWPRLTSGLHGYSGLKSWRRLRCRCRAYRR